MKTYVFRYTLKGEYYNLNITAENAEEAEEQIKAISANSVYQGELSSVTKTNEFFDLFGVSPEVFFWVVAGLVFLFVVK